MAFVGKLAYLFLFPGLMFMMLAGMLARIVLEGMSLAVYGGSDAGPGRSVPSLYRLFKVENVPVGGSLNAVEWIAPAVKILALSWVSCILFGFLDGDLVLIYALLLLASAGDVILCCTSSNPRVRQNSRQEITSVIGWAVPLGLVLMTVFLRTGEVSVSGIVDWQVGNGVLPASGTGGALALAGSAVAVIPALMAGATYARFRPFGRAYFADPPGGIAHDISGPPLAMLRISETVAYFVVPFMIAVLFFAGPASTWYEVCFWILKVLGVFILLAVGHMIAARARIDSVRGWLLGAGGLLALAGFVLVWLGVR